MTSRRPTYITALAPLLLLSACASGQETSPNQDRLPSYTPVYVENQNTYPQANTVNNASGAVRIQQTTMIRRPNGVISRAPLNRSTQTYQYPVNNNPITQPSMVVRTLPIFADEKVGYSNFDDWKQDFSTRAIASGYDAYNVQRLLAGAQLNNRVIAQDANQAEFVKMPWEYADSAVSDARVNNGKRKFASQRDLLNRLEAQYGVNAEIIAAIWGMESAYGAVTGNSYIPSSLSSLAYEGRRQEFAEEQLLALVRLLERGDVSWTQIDGSWAGGMGQTQFIPGTWLAQGVDGNGDGRRNPWTTADALSSTANYLSNSGWQRGLAPFYEVSLPASFDYNYANTAQTGAQWQALGLRSLTGDYLNPNTQFKLWLPAGANGPALLLSPNFDVIKVYNNSSSYALGVSLLGRAINGQSGIQTPWPRFERPLTRGQVRNLQQNLTALGFDTQGVDGMIGSNTRRAFAEWQARNGQTADGFITQRSAQALIR